MSGKELPKPVKTPMKLPAAEPGDDNKAVSANFHTTSLKALANQTDVPDVPALTDKEADQSSGTSGRDPTSSGKPASGRDLLSSQDLAKTKRVTKSSGEADKDENMAKSHKRSRTQEASDQPQSKPQPKLQQGPDGIWRLQVSSSSVAPSTPPGTPPATPPGTPPGTPPSLSKETPAKDDVVDGFTTPLAADLSPPSPGSPQDIAKSPAATSVYSSGLENSEAEGSPAPKVDHKTRRTLRFSKSPSQKNLRRLRLHRSL
jgi:hypothetical protein